MLREPRALKTVVQPDQSGPARKRGGGTDEHIHAEIYAAIIHHQIRPATPLQEDALASAFGVSRTIIRKVLQRLSHEKLVDLIPNKGAFVAKPSIEEARQVFEARRGVECLLIEKLASTITKADVERLTAMVGAEAEALEQDSKQKRLLLSGDFHRELASLAGNDVLRDFVHELVSRTSLIIALYESPGAVPCSYSEHKEIVDALKRRDGKKAAQYMDHHLRHIEAQIDLSDQPVRVDFRTLFKPRG
ncbi:GntR family transcriptional regulator [Aminobacter sp. Piv2-1]|uniref:GntR family transcriptional regulator n=1 Tax=Aminobacter sp. Piv2-1 TaxID=3031122 RepID=UPI0030AE2AC1